MRGNLWVFGVYAAAVVFVVAAMLLLSYVLGQRHHERHTGTLYEGGIVPESTAMARVSSDFYLVAAFFVVFDVETVFLFAWVAGAREIKGWVGFSELAIFVGVLVVALIYLWRAGALDWNARAYTRLRRGL